jgi:hypothetical protein
LVQSRNFGCVECSLLVWLSCLCYLDNNGRFILLSVNVSVRYIIMGLVCVRLEEFSSSLRFISFKSLIIYMGGRKSILLEGTQAMPARPDKARMRVKPKLV